MKKRVKGTIKSSATPATPRFLLHRKAQKQVALVSTTELSSCFDVSVGVVSGFRATPPEKQTVSNRWLMGVPCTVSCVGISSYMLHMVHY
jgi:hypothetical protein